MQYQVLMVKVWSTFDKNRWLLADVEALVTVWGPDDGSQGFWFTFVANKRGKSEKMKTEFREHTHVWYDMMMNRVPELRNKKFYHNQPPIKVVVVWWCNILYETKTAMQGGMYASYRDFWTWLKIHRGLDKSPKGSLKLLIDVFG